MPFLFLRATLESHGGILRTDKLRIIGEGGTHHVYVDPARSPDFVLKIARSRTSAGTASETARSWEPCRTDSELRRYFPVHWVARSYQASLPVQRDDGKIDPAATVIVQRYDSSFLKLERIPLQSIYLELLPASAADLAWYAAINSLLSDHVSADGVCDLARRNPELEVIGDLALRDPGFHAAVTAFLKGTVDFTKSTGQVLDLAGRDNVYFYRRSALWTCRIGEVIKGNRLDRLIELLECPRAWDDLADHDLAELINGLVFVRTVNFLGTILNDGPPIRLALSKAVLATMSSHFKAGLWRRRLISYVRALSRDE